MHRGHGHRHEASNGDPGPRAQSISRRSAPGPATYSTGSPPATIGCPVARRPRNSSTHHQPVKNNGGTSCRPVVGRGVCASPGSAKSRTASIAETASSACRARSKHSGHGVRCRTSRRRWAIRKFNSSSSVRTITSSNVPRGRTPSGEWPERRLLRHSLHSRQNDGRHAHAERMRHGLGHGFGKRLRPTCTIGPPTVQASGCSANKAYILPNKVVSDFAWPSMRITTSPRAARWRR